MTRRWWRGRGAIRSQMLAALIAVLVVASGVAVVGMAVMLRAERDFRALAEDHIPVVALAGNLAEATGELAALAVQLIADPASSGAKIPEGVDRAAKSVAEVLGSPLLQAPEHRVRTGLAIEAASRELRRALLTIEEHSAALSRLSQAETETDSQLRWTHADVQDQAQGLLRDLSFNMDARLAVLVEDSFAASRAAAENALTQDRRLRDQLQQLGAEAATLTALLLQARAASSQAGLDQVEALGHDTLDLIALTRYYLPNRSDIILFLQQLEALTDLASGKGSVLAQARQRLDLREKLLAEFDAAQTALSGMQSQLTELGQLERQAAQSRADLAATSILRGSFALTIVTLLGALMTAIILAVFVHQRILRRIEGLSDDLGRIALGDLSGQAPKPAADEIGGMEQSVEVFRNSVRERQQVIERLEVTQRELVQAGKMAALGQMSAAISHEINQPLAAIGHRLHNLRVKYPEMAPDLARLEQLLNRMTRTISHLRRFARRAEHRRVRVVLAEPLSAALELLEHRLRDAAVEIVQDDLQGLAVAGDEILLEQVFLNILGNAIDAIEETGRGSGLIEIRLARRFPPELVITDTGVGLGGQSGTALVDPFYTTKDPGKGLGLGLSIVYNVMQDMRGHLSIEERPEGGAEVRLRLAPWEEEYDVT